MPPVIRRTVSSLAFRSSMVVVVDDVDVMVVVEVKVVVVIVRVVVASVEEPGYLIGI